MKILLTGASGQVGFQLERSLQSLGQVVAPGRARMDLSDLDQVRAVMREVRPGLIVNAAAYTEVDKAERESALAHRINADAPAVMAQEARALDAAMVHYSTDYVFDGARQGAYVETDLPNPLNVYGHSKLAGEQAVAAAGIRHLILRTSWVYGVRGRNFLLTMLRLGAERRQVSVVADQHGAPTWSRTVADTTAAILSQARAGGPAWWEQHSGLYHLACQGQTTWAGFTEAIIEQARLDCAVLPVAGADFPAPARRPHNSVMCCDKLMSRFCALPHGEQALSLCLARAR
jgi:dTDP-4-dehydrorhamnose reductase